LIPQDMSIHYYMLFPFQPKALVNIHQNQSYLSNHHLSCGWIIMDIKLLKRILMWNYSGSRDQVVWI
jgi:hypothetical protein